MPGKLRVSRYPRSLVEEIYREDERVFSYSHRGHVHRTKAILWSRHRAAINRPGRLIGRKPGRRDEDQREAEEDDEVESIGDRDAEEQHAAVERHPHEVELLDIARPAKRKARYHRHLHGRDEMGYQMAPLNQQMEWDDQSEEWDVTSEEWESQSEEWELAFRVEE
ncbi:hypothetical protein B0H19DRAFT_1227092 [Mycena capillaripes]|nr:hypothetical protein B0H19DRAFT_1227092 [Mycena capillaripes]